MHSVPRPLDETTLSKTSPVRSGRNTNQNEKSIEKKNSIGYLFYSKDIARKIDTLHKLERERKINFILLIFQEFFYFLPFLLLLRLQYGLFLRHTQVHPMEKMNLSSVNSCIDLMIEKVFLFECCRRSLD
jgi:hypothetical protein